MKKLLFILLGAFIISSCTMEKRLYMPGRNVEWRSLADAKNKKNADNAVNKDKSVKQEETDVVLENSFNEVPTLKATDFIASNESEISNLNLEENKPQLSPKLQNEFDPVNINSLISNCKKKNTAREFLQNRYEMLKLSGDDPKGGGFGITSFVIGIVGLLFMGIVLGILAIIFGAIGMFNRKLKGLAIAGLILGIIDIVGAIIVIL